MSGSASLTLEQGILQHTLGITAMAFPAQVYVALCAASLPPSESIPGVEAFGGGYSRVAATFALLASPTNIAANTASVEFPLATAAWGSLGYFEVWTAQTGGSRLYWGGLVDPVSGNATTLDVSAGDIVRFSAGTLAIEVTASTVVEASGVSSFNTRTGDVILSNSDVVAVLPPSASPPLMDGAAAVGTSAAWARGDHVHPSDTATGVYVKNFGAVGDGVTDDTAALQAAVNSVVGLHGGRVHIGNLRLRINGAVVIPALARLSGNFRHCGLNASQDWYQYGAQICLGPSGSITVGGGCQIEHIVFIRAGLYTSLPANATDALAIVAAFAGTALDLSNAPDYLISECMFLGFTTAINAPNTSRGNIIDCMFDCTNGVLCTQSSDISRYERLQFWPFMTMLVPGVGAAQTPLRRVGYAMKMQNNTWDQCISCFQFGYDAGFWVDSCSNNNFVACHSDYLSPPSTSLGGFQFTGTTNYSKMVGCMSLTPVVVNVASSPSPSLIIAGGTFAGGTGVDVVAGGALVHAATFEHCATGVNFRSGTLTGSVVGCNFNVVPTPIAFASGAVQALVSVLGNTPIGGSPTISEQNIEPLAVPYLTVNAAGGPTIRAGTGAGTGTQPKGSMWLRTDGAVGSTLYVTQGGGTWAAVAGV